MTQRLFIDGPWAGRWMDFDDYHTVRHLSGTLYSLFWAKVPGWRIGLRFYTSSLQPGSKFPPGMVLPGHVAGEYLEREPIADRALS